MDEELELYLYGAPDSFWLFCLYYDREFFSSRPFLKDIALSLQDVFDGKLNSLAICLPPRSGKSYISSLFCAWALGVKPDQSVMRNTCTTTLYNKFSYDVRDVLRTDKFKEVFPEVTLSRDKSNVNGWNTNKAKQVSYFGSGVGGTIIGFGASLLAITDDLYRNYEDASSLNYIEKVDRWMQSTHGTRIEQGCKVIDIGTRWSKEDVIGKGIREDKYEKIIMIPAITEEGVSFCENVQTTAQFRKIEAETIKEIWSSAYQQEPVEMEGVVFNRDKMQFVDKMPQEFDTTFAYMDVADEGTDYLALVVGQLLNDKVYITDVLFTQDGVDSSLPQCVAMIDKYNPKYIRIEGNNQGKLYARFVKEKISVPTKILVIKNTTNKLTRIIMESLFIYDQFIFRGNTEYHSEYSKFMRCVFGLMKNGSSKYDDAPDALSGLSKMYRNFLPHIFVKRNTGS